VISYGALELPDTFSANVPTTMANIFVMPSITWVCAPYQRSTEQDYHLATHQAANRTIPCAITKTVGLFKRIAGSATGQRVDIKSYLTS